MGGTCARRTECRSGTPHTDTAASAGVSSQRDGLPPITQQALAIMRDIVCHGFKPSALHLDERTRIVVDLSDKRILFLCSLGLLTVGRTMVQAFMTMYRAEHTC